MAEVLQELRQDIERIRDDLDDELDALGEHVSPRQIAQRRKADRRDPSAQRRDGIGRGVGLDGYGPSPSRGRFGQGRRPAGSHPRRKRSATHRT